MTSTKDRLLVSRHIPAKRERVFEMWTVPEKMGWYCPQEMRIVSARSDVRVGGRFRASMQGEDGQVHTCRGRYTEIIPNRMLAFTHSWEEPDPVETSVVVHFSELDGGTEITLTQEGFEDPDAAKSHEEGWASTLEHLASQFPEASARRAAGSGRAW